MLLQITCLTYRFIKIQIESDRTDRAIRIGVTRNVRSTGHILRELVAIVAFSANDLIERRTQETRIVAVIIALVIDQSIVFTASSTIT